MMHPFQSIDNINRHPVNHGIAKTNKQKTRQPFQNLTNLSSRTNEWKRDDKTKAKLPGCSRVPCQALIIQATSTANTTMGTRQPFQYRPVNQAGRSPVHKVQNKAVLPVAGSKPSVQRQSIVHPFQNAIDLGDSKVQKPHVSVYISPAHCRSTEGKASSSGPKEYDIEQGIEPTDGPIDDMHDDQSFARSYANDIVLTYRSQEKYSVVSPFYLTNQPHVSHQHRSILIDWLMRVHSAYQCSDQTLHLAVSLIDRFLDTTRANVRLNTLQLFGVTCYFIACKYEEIEPVSTGDLVHLCDHQYTVQDYVRAEEHILMTLDHRISLPTAISFLDPFVVTSKTDEVVATLARHILANALTSSMPLHCLPSTIAAVGLFLAYQKYELTWTPKLVHCTGYQEHDLMPLASSLVEIGADQA